MTLVEEVRGENKLGQSGVCNAWTEVAGCKHHVVNKCWKTRNKAFVCTFSKLLLLLHDKVWFFEPICKAMYDRQH